MTTKEELEKNKLAAEIAELSQKVEFEAKKARWSGLRTFTTFTLTFISIAAGLITLIINSSTFLAQRQKMQNVELSQNMINLVDKLNADDTYKQENAAILLSYYNLDAIPILLKNLERVENPEATIYSLELIKENEGVRSNEVIDPLLNSAKKIFANNIIMDDRTVFAFRNYIRALAYLGMEKKNNVLILLNQLYKRIDKNEQVREIKITDPNAHIIKTEIDKSITKINKFSLSLGQKE
jgi:hypothetical protein